MTRALTPDDFVYGLSAAGDPQLSPDSSRLLYSVGKSLKDKKAGTSQVWISNRDGSDARQLTHAGTRNGSARWSADGGRIAFVSDRTAKGGIYVMETDLGEPREVTTHNTPVFDLAWSPDGKTIAYTALWDPENPDEKDPGPEDVARVRVTSRLDYKQDNRGYLGDLRMHTWLVDVASGERRRLTTELADHNFPAWSPDGKTIAVKVPRKNGMRGNLALIDVATGASTFVGGEDGTMGCWAWSPSGDRLLLAADDAATWQYDLWVYTVASKQLRRLTTDLQCQPDGGFPTVSPPSQPRWLDERRAVFHALHAGASGYYAVDTTTGEVSELASWKAMNGAPSSDASGRWFAQGTATMSSIGEIAVWDRETGETMVVTHLNDSLLTEAPAAASEFFQIQRGQYTIDCWLLKPHGYQSGKKYPLVLDVHGGPNSWYGWAMNGVQQTLAGRGCFVLYTNPRGSGSYGRNFTQQVSGDWGGEDYLDLMAAVDEACKRPDVDSSRLGCYGYSYGGFMTSWVIGHTPRFSAAAIGAPVVDLVSMFGTSDISHDFLRSHIGGTPDTNPEGYKKHSPLTYLHTAKTPSLIVHGEADDRCPIGQGEQCFIALKEAGCEVEFVRYPGQAHPFVRVGPAVYRLDFLTRLSDWFGGKLGA